MLSRKIIDKVHFAALIVSLIGGLFKLMHWPGANVMLIQGMGLLSICYILFGLTAEENDLKKKYINYARNFSIAILLMGVLFSLMHWPGAPTMLYAGVGSFVLSFVLQMILPNSDKDK